MDLAGLRREYESHGIDVGDLSSTMVCSVPPTPTNYLQRIGRAGRATGNALILALANVKPTDALIVGMYQQLGDQVGENAGIVRQILAKK